MGTNQTDLFLFSNAKYFQPTAMPLVKQLVSNFPPEKQSLLLYLQFKDPVIMLVVSLFVGCFGIDRFIDLCSGK